MARTLGRNRRHASAIHDGVRDMADYKLYLSEAGTNARRPEENTELELELVDNNTLERLKVRAVVASSFDRLPDADRLWLYPKGAINPLEQNPWAIRILEMMEDEPAEAPTAPRQKTSLGRMRGGMLEALIRQREQKEKQEGE
ncbi:MAG TPA: hypothetical protein VJO15_06740 [Dehalococcoidia bacterium]|nr:hypothetical protein [Dehalococcoidia bacterium]